MKIFTQKQRFSSENSCFPWEIIGQEVFRKDLTTEQKEKIIIETG